MTPERWQQINEVFHAALARDSRERAAYLAEACAGDADLHTEVESLLAAHAQPGDFIDVPVYEVAAELLTQKSAELSAGEQLGAYSILEPLGAGGMGEVYLAEDTRLRRRVALKLLPADFTANPDRLRRFQREALATSALNHPNIVTIYEFGETGGRHFIATEFVAGQTLRQRLAAGAMSLSESLDVATQIASALVAAHAEGIIHRDIKPENVMLRPDGLVKVLDFGLAKLAGRDAGKTEPLAAVPKGNTPSTTPGVVMGTFNYMSPEQARGLQVDARTDLFSLGALIHELIAGQPPFAGATPSDLIAAILTQQPPLLQQYCPEAPAELQSIVARALCKDREERYQSSKELLAELQSFKWEWEFKAKLADSAARLNSGNSSANAGHDANTSQPPVMLNGTQNAGAQAPAVRERSAAGAVARRKLGLRWLLATLGGLLLAATAVLVYWRGEWRKQSSLGATQVVPVTTFPGREDYAAFSPDGNQLAFAWDGDGDNTDIYVKLIGVGQPLRLTTNPAEDSKPAWSPDGRYIAFIRYFDNKNEIYLIPALGGAERKVGQTIRNTSGLAWSPDGKSLIVTDQYPPGGRFALCQLSLETLEKRGLTSPPSDNGDRSPAFSPDGQQLAFVRTSSLNVASIYVQPASGGAARQLVSGLRLNSGLAWTADSQSLIFSSNRAGAFNLWRATVAGGEPEMVAIAGRGVYNPAISRQGTRLAYNERYLDSNIWRMELTGAAKDRRSAPTKFIFSSRADDSPQFSPDGRKIAFASDRSGSDEIWVCDSDGANLLQLTFFGGTPTGSPRWSPDGRQIAFDSRPNGNSDIFVISAEGGQPRAVTTETSNEMLPSWSRDGRWIYCRSNRNGSWQIWKLPVAGGPTVQVTRQEGFEAFESPDGRFLYYTKGGPPGIWQVPVEGGEETLVPELTTAGYWRYWAVTNDGIYFAAKEEKGPPGIKFFKFSSRQLVPVGPLEKEPLAGPFGLCVSPDGRWLLFVQADQSVSDIMLIENFR